MRIPVIGASCSITDRKRESCRWIALLVDASWLRALGESGNCFHSVNAFSFSQGWKRSRLTLRDLENPVIGPLLEGVSIQK